MIKAILLTLTVIFAVLGLCDIIYTVKTMLLYSGVKSDNYLVVFLRKGYAYSQLKFYSYKLRWYGNEFCDRIIALTDNLSEMEIADCEELCYGTRIYLCNFVDIKSVINSFNIGETGEKQSDCDE